MNLASNGKFFFLRRPCNGTQWFQEGVELENYLLPALGVQREDLPDVAVVPS